MADKSKRDKKKSPKNKPSKTNPGGLKADKQESVSLKELAEDEAIQEADTLLLTIPNTLGVDYNLHVLSSILEHVAPGLGWR